MNEGELVQEMSTGNTFGKNADGFLACGIGFPSSAELVEPRGWDHGLGHGGAFVRLSHEISSLSLMGSRWCCVGVGVVGLGDFFAYEVVIVYRGNWGFERAGGMCRPFLSFPGAREKSVLLRLFPCPSCREQDIFLTQII